MRTLTLFALALTANAAGETNNLLPEGAEREVLVRVCSSCHPVEQIVIQRRTADEWDQVIAVMLDRGAVATAEEQAAIRDYLSRHFGVSQ